tara:strand:- start:83 stop:784 length:702 start_codon:yes stop_codon:yes gene_type:complete
MSDQLTSEDMNELFVRTGIAHCDVKTKLHHNYQVFSTNLGWRHPIVNTIRSMENEYHVKLSGGLDDVVQRHVPRIITERIQTYTNPITYSCFYAREGDQLKVPANLLSQCVEEHIKDDEHIDIIDVFYKTATVEYKYPVCKYSCTGNKQYCGFVSSEDMGYMTYNLLQLDEHLEHLKTNLDQLTINSTTKKKQFTTKITKSIEKIEKKCRRLQCLLEHVPVKDDCKIEWCIRT